MALIGGIIYRIFLKEKSAVEEQVGERLPKTGTTYVTTSVEIYKENSIEGKNTYRLFLTPSNDIQNIHTIYNSLEDEDSTFKIQKSYHVDKPFGSDINPPSDVFFGCYQG